MFWGLVLEPEKRYSTTVEKSFHVSKAVLDCSSIRNDNEILNVMLETEGSESILCNLCKQKGVLQESLDLNFMTGDRLTFECRGNGRIHMSGYLLPDEDDEMSGLMDEESEEEEEEEAGASSPVMLKKEKRKMDGGTSDNPSKKTKITADDDEEDEDDGSDAEGSDLSEDVDDEDLDDEEDEEGEDEGSDDDEEDSPNLNQQQNKSKNKTPNKQKMATPKKTPVTNGMAPKEQKSNKKTPGGGPASSPNTTPKQKKVLELGVVIKDLKVGSGQPVKSGKTVGVRYLGKLKEGGKVFDKSMKGEGGFKFKLGKGDVIKGWDIGVQGMRVGGKRVIHCPAEAAYGARGAPPKIPPNSALVFEVEVLSVY